jgi:N-acetylglucosaminyl-diphospho-decaprenol L-rhamnosyltransferase
MLDLPVCLAADPDVNIWDIVVVSYNSSRDFSAFWLNRPFPSWVNIIVVDNGSSDDSVRLAHQFANVVLQSKNVGLSKSNNAGLAQGTAPLVAFCNPDVFLDTTVLQKLAPVTGSAGIVAPRLHGADGTRQPNGRAWPTVVRQFSRKRRPKGKTAASYLWPNNPDWVTGAFMAGSRDLFEAVGGWPEKYFLYFEDVQLCLSARQLGYSVTLVEDIHAVHSWRQSSSSPLSRSAWAHFRSFVRFYFSHPKMILTSPLDIRGG